MCTIKSTVIKIVLLPILLGLLGEHLCSQTLKEKQAVAEGNNQYMQKKYSLAMANYTKALVEDGNNVKANFNIGNTLFKVKQYDKAQEYYLKAIKNTTDPKIKAEAYHNLGNAFMQSHEYKKAVEAYKSALRNNPKDNQTRYNLVLAKRLESEKKKNNPADLPKPSEFAKRMKIKADKLAKEGKFSSAYKLMSDALLQDSTVNHFQDYMKKLNEVIIMDTIK